MNLKYFFFVFFFYFYHEIIECNSESITYLSTERPEIIWYDSRYFRNASLLSRRFSRRDPKHYVEAYVESLFILNNTLKLDFYFYQFLTNRYRPSFVEMHFKLCDMINSDSFFGEAMRNALDGRLCPYPPGKYHMKNMSVPFVPKGFPFTKGRIYLNVSLTVGGVSRQLSYGSIDMEIKVAKIKKN